MNDRLEESRRRVQERLREIGDEAERKTQRALAIKDAALGVLGVVGALLAARQLSKALSRGRRAEEDGQRSERPRSGRPSGRPAKGR